MRLIDQLKNTINSRYYDYQKTEDDYMPQALLYEEPREVQYITAPNAKNFLNYKKQQSFKDYCLDNSVSKLSVDEHDVIREKMINLVVIGYGGFMANLLYFISQLTNGYIFESIHIYEDDKLTLLNTVRIFKDLQECPSSKGSKLDMFTNEQDIVRRRVGKVPERFTEKSLKGYSQDTLFIGSPDFATRKLLAARNFLFFGHSGSETIIHKSPQVDSDMAVETYGKMHVSDFHKGVLKSAQDFLRILVECNPNEISLDTPISKIDVDKRTEEFNITLKERFNKEDYDEVHF